MHCARPLGHRARRFRGRPSRSLSLLAPPLLSAALAISVGCADSTSPTAPPRSAPVGEPPPPAPSPSGPAEFPPVAGTAAVYAGAESLTDLYLRSHGAPLMSRFVFDSDGTFRLQFLSESYGFFEYRGRYALSGWRLTFDWDGWSVMGPWGATGTLIDDVLRVEYNDVMRWNDFVDGQYVRVPAMP